MIINTYGCSWTSGVSLQYGNWPLYCSIKRPDIHWNNYGRAGSSLTWSTFISQLGLNNADINIVQVTTPWRLTTWNTNISKTPHKFFRNCNDKKFENQGENYTQYRVTSDVNILNTTPGNLKKAVKNTNGLFRTEEKNFPEMYYERVNEELQYFEWMTSLHYLIENVDFVFLYDSVLHERYRFLDTKNVPCFFESEFFNKYCIDEGNHFNSEGNQLLADWVLHKIRRLI